MRFWIVLATSLATLAGLSSVALARCTIHNETEHSFTLESGNVGNQRVGAHTTTSIASGDIHGESDDGKRVAGMCRDGGSVRMIDDHGQVRIVHD